MLRYRQSAAVSPPSDRFDADSDLDPTSPPTPATTGDATPAGDPERADREREARDRRREVVESRRWYWIAAVPVYFVLATGVSLFALALIGIAVGLDLVGAGGFAGPGLVTLLAFGAAVFAAIGVVLAVAFPIAVYLDARAVGETGYEWDPDAALYGLVAVVGVIATNFLVSVPLALYYLYRRHEAVGTP